MVDRTDIDALLIGALYGELTPADEARLAAHLESHPADRTALDDLTRTRAAVRDSRILAFQFEPRQSISALLLQEASRRAPRAVTDRGETATWFQRFVRSFMAHPAMAAAAMLVLVVSVAGTLYLRGTDQLARPEVADLERAPTVSTAAAPSPRASVPTAVPVTSAPALQTPTGAPGSSAEPAAGSGAYRVGLDGAPAAGELDTVAKSKLAQPQAAAAGDPSQAEGDFRGRASYEETNARGLDAVRDAERRKLDAVTKAAPARPSKAEAVHGIELRTPQLQPKDFADDEKSGAGRREAAAEATRDQRRGAVAGGGAPASPPAAAPPPPSAPVQANAPAPRASGPSGAANFDAPQEQTAANEAKRPAAKPSVPQTAPSFAPSAQSAQVDRRVDKAANAGSAANTVDGDARQSSADRTLLEWARKQRDQVIAYVNQNRCREAASTAVEIYNRAPDYYNANVATDRQIKPCIAYVATERDRADRKRASKSAADVQAPAQAAPSRK